MAEVSGGPKTPGGLRKGFLGGNSDGSRGEFKGSGVPLDVSSGERAVFINEMGYPVATPKAVDVDEDVSKMLGRATASELEGYIQFLKDLQASKSASGPVSKISTSCKNMVIPNTNQGSPNKTVIEKSDVGYHKASDNIKDDEDLVQVPPRKRRPWQGNKAAEELKSKQTASYRPPFQKNQQKLNKAPATQNPPQKPSLPSQQPAWHFAPGRPAATWKDICTLGRKVEEDCSLNYVPPTKSKNGKLYATISRDEIIKNVEKWSNTLVGYVMGDKPFYSHLRACVGRLWKLNGSLEIHSRENGFFFFKFGSREEYERILHEGPWLFNGRLIILKPWSEDIGLDRDLLSTVPVWVRFPNLHLKLWSQSILSKAASLVGYPLYMDKATAKGERLAYARCFVEISATAKLPRKVLLEIENGEIMEIPIEFEWVPPICVKCKSFGHSENQCSSVEVWVPKKVASIPETVPMASVSATSNSSKLGEQQRKDKDCLHEDKLDEEEVVDSDIEEIQMEDENGVKINKESDSHINMETEKAEDTLQQEDSTEDAVHQMNTGEDSNQKMNSEIMSQRPSNRQIEDLEVLEDTAEHSDNFSIKETYVQDDGKLDNGLPKIISEENPEWQELMEQCKKDKAERAGKKSSKKVSSIPRRSSRTTQGIPPERLREV